MQIGISNFFGYENIDKYSRYALIKYAGFETFISSANLEFKNRNGTFAFQIKLSKKFGLKPSSLHSSYDNNTLHYFWEEGKEGDFQEKNYIKEVKIAKKYGFSCLVVHMAWGKPTQIGLDRIKRILKVCEKYRLPLAVENLIDLDMFKFIMNNINHPYLKFCYDSGHNHCFTNDSDILDTYGDRLMCLHLHDNMGDIDDHTISKYGNIDWENVAQKLAKTKIEILDYELLNKTHTKDFTITGMLNECYKDAIHLKELIEKYRKTQN